MEETRKVVPTPDEVQEQVILPGEDTYTLVVKTFKELGATDDEADALRRAGELADHIQTLVRPEYFTSVFDPLLKQVMDAIEALPVSRTIHRKLCEARDAKRQANPTEGPQLPAAPDAGG